MLIIILLLIKIIFINYRSSSTLQYSVTHTRAIGFPKKKLLHDRGAVVIVSILPSAADQNPGTIDCATYLRLCLHVWRYRITLPILLLLLLFEFRSTNRFRFPWHSPHPYHGEYRRLTGRSSKRIARSEFFFARKTRRTYVSCG